VIKSIEEKRQKTLKLTEPNGQYKYIYVFTNKIIPISALIVRQLKIKDGDKLDRECLVEKGRNH
jgi:hypothetical protein